MSMGDYKKPMDSYTWARLTGRTDDTIGSMIGAMDRQHDREERARSEARRREQLHKDIEARRKKKAAEDESAKVICTELRRQGLMNREDYELCTRHAREHLSDRHFRGYHAWALAVVGTMRRSRSSTGFWRFLAQARTDHIAFLYGDLSRRNRFGALLCTFGHPACWCLGSLVREQDWKNIYREDAKT
jgi:hypothetical protein